MEELLHGGRIAPILSSAPIILPFSQKQCNPPSLDVLVDDNFPGQVCPSIPCFLDQCAGQCARLLHRPLSSRVPRPSLHHPRRPQSGNINDVQQASGRFSRPYHWSAGSSWLWQHDWHPDYVSSEFDCRVLLTVSWYYVSTKIYCELYPDITWWVQKYPKSCVVGTVKPHMCLCRRLQ